MSAAAAGAVLGVLVPCHDEAGVIERKLRNLAAVRWPASERPHALIVVDDHSSDDTARLAAESIERLFDPARVRIWWYNQTNCLVG